MLTALNPCETNTHTYTLIRFPANACHTPRQTRLAVLCETLMFSVLLTVSHSIGHTTGGHSSAAHPRHKRVSSVCVCLFSDISCGVCLQTQNTHMPAHTFSTHGSSRNEWGVMSGSLKYTTAYTHTYTRPHATAKPPPPHPSGTATVDAPLHSMMSARGGQSHALRECDVMRNGCGWWIVPRNVLAR